jgi:hypothetical protein
VFAPRKSKSGKSGFTFPVIEVSRFARLYTTDIHGGSYPPPRCKLPERVWGVARI